MKTKTNNKRIEIGYAGGVSSVILDLKEQKVFVYAEAPDNIHNQYGGEQYYTSRSSLSGKGWIPANPNLHVLETTHPNGYHHGDPHNLGFLNPEWREIEIYFVHSNHRIAEVALSCWDRVIIEPPHQLFIGIEYQAKWLMKSSDAPEYKPKRKEKEIWDAKGNKYEIKMEYMQCHGSRLNPWRFVDELIFGNICIIEDNEYNKTRFATETKTAKVGEYFYKLWGNCNYLTDQTTIDPRTLPLCGGVARFETLFYMVDGDRGGLVVWDETEKKEFYENFDFFEKMKNGTLITDFSERLARVPEPDEDEAPRRERRPRDLQIAGTLILSEPLPFK